MKILFAKHMGFCSGVRRAVKIAMDSLKNDPKPVQFLGEIVHNELIIDKVNKKGGKTISSFEEAEEGTVIIRAHGLPPTKTPKNIYLRDTTCPLVERVQKTAQRFYNQGYQVIIIGEKEHSEVKGINGYTKNNAIIISDIEKAKELDPPKKAAAVIQTTKDHQKAERIIEILDKKIDDFKWENTICPEVISRQRELEEIFEKSEAILVIGSKKSANTGRLAQMAKDRGKKVWWLNTKEELAKEVEKGNFEKIKTLGVVSGTSALDSEVKKIKIYLKKHFEDHEKISK